MALRIVVAFATDLPLSQVQAAEEHLAALASLRDRAEARGGRLCALEAQGVAFDFAVEDLEEALSLALSAQRDRGPPHTTLQVTRWGVGIAEGDMTPLCDVGSLALPSWGVPLVIASVLARLATAGEVLVDRELAAVQSGELLTSGARDGMHGSAPVHGMRVDVARLFRCDEVAGRSAPLPAESDESVAALRGDVELTSTARRLTALEALARGDVGDALVTLQTSMRVEHDAAPDVRSRGWLALALGLAVAGHRTEALFAALEALARAREAGEPGGEPACLRFLAKLSLAAGHGDVAERWELAPAPPG